MSMVTGAGTTEWRGPGSGRGAVDVIPRHRDTGGHSCDERANRLAVPRAERHNSSRRLRPRETTASVPTGPLADAPCRRDQTIASTLDPFEVNSHCQPVYHRDVQQSRRCWQSPGRAALSHSVELFPTRAMPTNVFHRGVVCAIGVPVLLLVAPASYSAQSGKWVATISQLGSAGGAADVTIDPRNDKQSRAKIIFRNTKRDMRLAW